MHIPTWGVPLSVSYHFAFSYCSWGSQGKNTEVVFHSLLQRTTFCQTSPPWSDCLGCSHMAWLSFIELDKTVVLWSDWLVFCDYGFSVSVLWCPLATPTILLGFLLHWTWGISSWLLQQSAAAAPYLGREVSFHSRPSWPWTWNSSSPSSCAHAAATHTLVVVVMLKILQARLQQYVNHELPDVQAGFRKGRGTRDQIANISWITEKAREFQKKHLFLLYWLRQSIRLCGSQ